MHLKTKGEIKKKFNLKFKVSKYAGERLHMEIPKAYRFLFEVGDEFEIDISCKIKGRQTNVEKN